MVYQSNHFNCNIQLSRVNHCFSNHILLVVHHWLYGLHMIYQSRVNTTKWSVKTEAVLSVCIRKKHRGLTEVQMGCESWLPRDLQLTVLTTSPHCSSWMFYFYRLTGMELNYEECTSLASSLQSPDCPLRKLHLGGCMYIYPRISSASQTSPLSKQETMR